MLLWHRTEVVSAVRGWSGGFGYREEDEKSCGEAMRNASWQLSVAARAGPCPDFQR